MQPKPTPLRRARVAVWCYFMLPGITVATWTARLPAVKAQAHLSNGELSVGLLAIGIGSLASMRFVGPAIDRYGSAAVMRPAGALVALTIIGSGWVTNIGELALSLMMYGVSCAMLDISMNAQAVQVERAYRRPIMASFHAVYSIGGVAGAIYGGVLAYAGASPGITFTLIGVPMAIASIPIGRWLLPPGPSPAVSETGKRRRGVTAPRWTRIILVLGLLGLCCMLDESIADDWGSVYLRDSLHTAASIAPFAFGAFCAAMTVSRLCGDRIVARIGPVATVRWGAGFAAAGLAAGLSVPNPVAAIAGFGALGGGLSCVVPQIFTTAGNWDPRHSGILVARVTSLSYLGGLAGPVIIGPLADATSLRAALYLPAALATIVAVLATAVRPRRTVHPSPDKRGDVVFQGEGRPGVVR
jgi:MFS family permease